MRLNLTGKKISRFWWIGHHIILFGMRTFHACLQYFRTIHACKVATDYSIYIQLLNRTGTRCTTPKGWSPVQWSSSYGILAPTRDLNQRLPWSQFRVVNHYTTAALSFSNCCDRWSMSELHEEGQCSGCLIWMREKIAEMLIIFVVESIQQLDSTVGDYFLSCSS